jgi:hypothetical protein
VTPSLIGPTWPLTSKVSVLSILKSKSEGVKITLAERYGIVADDAAP